MASKIKNRGWFLTIMLVLFSILLIFQFHLAIYPSAYKDLYRGMPAWYQGYMLIDLLISIVILIGLWTWKKWAIYLLTGVVIVEFVVSFLTGELMSLANLMFSALMITLVFWSILRKKELFT